MPNETLIVKFSWPVGIIRKKTKGMLEHKLCCARSMSHFLAVDSKKLHQWIFMHLLFQSCLLKLNKLSICSAFPGAKWNTVLTMINSIKQQNFLMQIKNLVPTSIEERMPWSSSTSSCIAIRISINPPSLSRVMSCRVAPMFEQSTTAVVTKIVNSTILMHADNSIVGKWETTLKRMQSG